MALKTFPFTGWCVSQWLQRERESWSVFVGSQRPGFKTHCFLLKIVESVKSWNNVWTRSFWCLVRVLTLFLFLQLKVRIILSLFQGRFYTSGHIMLTMGSDYQYTNALQNFKNLDKLIHHANQRVRADTKLATCKTHHSWGEIKVSNWLNCNHSTAMAIQFVYSCVQLQKSNGSKVNVFYSTPACYAYAVSQQHREYTEKSDDFFPYASAPHAFWTGYFTSRPALKRYVRTTNNFFQVCCWWSRSRPSRCRWRLKNQ